MRKERFNKVVEWNFNLSKEEKETYWLITLGAIPIIGQIIWLAVTLLVIFPDVKRKVYWVKSSQSSNKPKEEKS